MIARNLPTFLSSCLLTGLVGTAAGTALSLPSQPRDELALRQLQSDFHGASALADYDLMQSIWTEDAVFMGGPNVVEGATNIANFFANGPNWGTTANLSPTYKSTFDIHGNRATIQFECVIVTVGGGSPLTTPLSTLPPGSQNPNVEIFQHSNATVEAVKQGGVWRIESFSGAGGAIAP